MALTLFYSPFHTFVHKVLVTAHECGLWDQMVRVPTFPFYNNDGEFVRGQYSLAKLTPLDKVPTLAAPDGQVIYGSQAICEYLDSVATARRMYPAPGPARWDAVTRLALCDTLFELTVQMVMEQWNPPETQRMALFEWIWPKIIAGLDTLEAGARQGWADFDVGHAAMLHMISYITFRSEFYPAKDPLYPGFNWRDGRPALTAWYTEALTRPSVQSHYNLPYEGDKSAAYHQHMVQAVLDRQQAHLHRT